jgi:hypothetical protein
VNLNFAEALRALVAGAVFLIANGARPAASYLFASFLPEMLKYDYQAKSGNMIVRSIMAGLAGMVSPYPESSVIEVSKFDEETAKIANTVRMTEAALRQLQQMLMQLMISGQATNEVMLQEALNFLDKVIVQGHLDTMEWLRGQALLGSIDWTFNGKRLLVDYGIPSGNKLTARTGNDGYGGSSSKFWTDVRGIRRVLKHNVRAILAHPDTIDMIRYNSVNSLVVISGGDNGQGPITFRKVNAQGQFTQDVADTITLIGYGLEGEVEDPANPGKSKLIPFLATGKLVGVGNNSQSGYVVGQGSTPAPVNALGYTHLAPTVEGGGRPGRWADLYTPQDQPWQLVGRGVTNGLPVLEAPEKVAIATTEMV